MLELFFMLHFFDLSLEREIRYPEIQNREKYFSKKNCRGKKVNMFFPPKATNYLKTRY